MMKVFLFGLLLAAPLVMGYDEKFDKMDVDKILSDETLMKAYVECLLDKGPCEVENAPEFKKILPEIIETNCKKCTEKQIANVKKMVKQLQEKRIEDFKEFRAKYDPTGKHEADFISFVYSN